MRKLPTHVLVLFAWASILLARCGARTQLDGARTPPIDDASAPDVRPDAACAGTFSALDDTSKWSTFDTEKLSPGASGFYGGAFDGRYVYFAPYHSSCCATVTARYDTSAPFGDAASWQSLDLPGGDGNTAFMAGAFDGRFVYLLPLIAAPVTRYDTTGDFTNLTNAWTTGATPEGFAGAVFDGRYLYAIPVSGGTVARYDTTGPLAPSSWLLFDLATLDASATEYAGGTFDGRYVYFAPADHDGVAARLDTTIDFASAASWKTSDLTKVDPRAKGFLGAVFDGRNVYFVPHDGQSFEPLVVRYDVSQPFDAVASWTGFDLATLNAGARDFAGATFDGRYLYFVPFLTGVVTRFDTTASLTDVSAWSTFDVSAIDGGGFFGALFDGRYVYFVPVNGGTVARFDARTPPCLPASWSSSFL